MEEKDFTQIERLLQGKLTAADQAAAKQKATADPVFADELAFQTQVARVVVFEENERLKNLLRADDAQLQATEKPTARIVPFRVSRLAAAAVFALLIFGAWWIFLRQTPEKLFAASFKPYENVLFDEYGGLTERGENQSKTPIDQAFSDLKTKNYAAAANEFSKLASEKSDARFHFYEAQSLAADGKTQEAIALFQPFATDKNSIFYGPANWNIALAHLKNGDAANAKNWLTKITTDSSLNYKKKEAAALLEKLN